LPLIIKVSIHRKHFHSYGQNIAGIGYILYLRNISFSSVSGSILARRSLSVVFEFGSVRFDQSDSSVRFGFRLSNSYYYYY